MRHAVQLRPLALAPLLLLGACVGVFRTPALQRGHLLSEDQVRLSYEVRGAGSPTLLFIHGWSGNREQWEAAASALARDHLVVTLDLAGHGDSGDNREAWSLDGFADDVEAALRQLHLRDVVLIGHSMGGPVACLAAARVPDRVRAVIGVDTLQSVDFAYSPAMIAPLVADFESDYEGTFRRSIQASVGSDADPAVTERLVRDAVATSPAVALGVLGSYPGLDLKAVLAATPVPVLCINSASSLPTDLEANRAVKPDYDAIILEGYGHYPMLEDPARFETELRAALQRLDVR